MKKYDASLMLAKQQLIALEGPVCNFCGADDRFLVLDHVVARAKGGDEHITNLQLLCEPCNILKADLDVAGLKQKGLHREATRLQEALSARANWNEDVIETALQNAAAELPTQRYERLTVYTQQHDFGKALTARMVDRGITETRLRREIAGIVGNCYGKNISRWRRTQYPCPAFFRAISIVLEWPLKMMWHFVEPASYFCAPKAEVCQPLMPYLIQEGYQVNTLCADIGKRFPGELESDTYAFFKTGILYKHIIPTLTAMIPTLTPELLKAHCYHMSDASTAKKVFRDITRLPPTNPDALHAFLTWLQYERTRKGYSIKHLRDILVTGEAAVSVPTVQRDLSPDYDFLPSIPIWGVCCLLLDLDCGFADVPPAVMPPAWERLKTMVAQITATWQQAFIKKVFKRTEGKSATGLSCQCSVSPGQAGAWLNRTPAIPKNRYPAVVAYLGWAAPDPPGHQVAFAARQAKAALEKLGGQRR